MPQLSDLIELIKKPLKIRTHLKVAEECLERGEYERAIEEAEEALKLSPGHKSAEEIRSRAGSARFKELCEDARRHYDAYIEMIDVSRLEMAKQSIELALQIRYGVSDDDRNEARNLRYGIQHVTEFMEKFRRAQELHRSGELDACLKRLMEITEFPRADELRLRVEREIEEAKKLYDEASDELDKGTPDEAKRLLDEAISRYADYPGRKSIEERLERSERIEGLLRESRSSFQEGELERAYDLAKEAWDIAGSDRRVSEWYEGVRQQLVDKLRLEAQRAKDSGELERAIATYERLLQFAPYDSDARGELESLRSTLSRIESLVEEGMRAIRDREFNLALDRLASAKDKGFRLSSIDSLERRLNEELERTKGNGLSEFREGRLEEAVRLWEMIPEGCDQFGEIKERLADARRRMESAAERIASAKRYFEDRDFEPAERLIGEAIELYPQNAEAIDLRRRIEGKLKVIRLVEEGRRRYESGDLDGAWNALEEATAADREDEAVRELRGTIEPKRDDLLRRCERIEALLDEGDIEGAEAELEIARDLGFRLERLDELSRKVAQTVERISSLLDSAEEAIRMKRFKTAVQKLDALLKLNPSHPRARELIEEARRRDAEHEMLLKAKSYLSARDYVRCIRELETLLREYPSSEEGTELMRRAKEEFTAEALSEARRLIERGRLEEAERRCEGLLRVVPENEEAGALREEIQRRRSQAMTLIEEARRGISSGELNEARRRISEAKRLDADLDVRELEKELSAKRRALELLERAREREKEGILSEGMRLAREAFELDPSLTEARELFERLQLMVGISGPMLVRFPHDDIPDTFVIPKRVTDIGRLYPGVENDVYFRIPNISRKHAQLINANGDFTIADLGSSYGTFINGVRLDPMRGMELHDGDILRLGQMVEMRFSQRSGSSTAVLTVLGLPEEVRERIDRVEPIMLETKPETGTRLAFTDEGGEISLGGGGDDDIHEEGMGLGTQAKLTYRDGRFWIEPALGGEVYVNDEKIGERRVLQPGDEVRIGDLILEVDEAETVVL
jgi:tetratricopeptide (TPR) repeat protein